MDCASIRARLVELVYGEIDAGERGSLARHLESCAACAAERASFDRTRQLLDAYEVPAIPLARIGAARPQRRTTAFRVAAALLWILLGGALLLRVRVRAVDDGLWIAFGALPSAAPADPAGACDGCVTLDQALTTSVAACADRARAETEALALAVDAELDRLRAALGLQLSALHAGRVTDRLETGSALQALLVALQPAFDPIHVPSAQIPTPDSDPSKQEEPR